MKQNLFFLCVLFVAGSVFAQTQPTQINTSTTVPIASSGRTAGPLTEQKISQDGSAGLAYQSIKTQKENVSNKTEKQVRRLRAIERDYSLPTSTFSIENFEQTETLSDLNVQTMPEAVNALNKERYRFEECSEGSDRCMDFEIDEAGEVIFK